MIAQYLERMKKVVVCVSSPIQLKLKVLQYIGCTKNTYGINLNLKHYIRDLDFYLSFFSKILLSLFPLLLSSL